MAKFIIYHDAGFGKDYEIVEAKSSSQAGDMAYDKWKEEAEANADYGVEPYTKERAVEEGLEDE